jgi:hypothetical protein
MDVFVSRLLSEKAEQMNRMEHLDGFNVNHRARKERVRRCICDVVESLEGRCYLSVTFGPLNTSQAISPTNGVIFAADFDHSGSNDLLVNTTPNGGIPGQTTEILWGSGDGTFSSVTAGPSAPAGFNYQVTDTVGDVNGDGKPDIIQEATKQVVANGVITYDTEIISYINQGNGTFTSATGATVVPVNTAPLPGVPIQVADLNGDGKSDAFLEFNQSSPAGDNYIVMLSAGDGDGKWSAGQEYVDNLGFGFGPVKLLAGNFFGHGRTDIAAVDLIPGNNNIFFGFNFGSTAAVVLWENNGNGSLTQVDQPTEFLDYDSTPSVAAGDFNGDGITDLVFASASSTTSNLSFQVYQNDGAGNLAADSSYFLNQPVGSFVGISAGDFDGDGKADVLETTTTIKGDQGNVYLGNGDGSFQAPANAITNAAAPTNGFQAIDLNRDGKADVVGVVTGGITYIESALNTSLSPAIGWVDVGNMNVISGWGYDPTSPATSINIEVAITGGPTQIFAANQNRPDLQNVIGSTNHGFTYSTPMLSEGNHTATVFAIQHNGAKVVIGVETLVSQNSLFDEHYYLQKYPDVAAAVAAGTIATGYDHYVRYGQFEGRSPSPFWDEQYYLQKNPDIASAVAQRIIGSGFMHYYLYGQYEGRGGLTYFDTAYYLQNNPDVVAAIHAGAVTSAYQHFVLYGQYEGRSPIPYFSQAVYEANNHNVISQSTGEPYNSPYEQYVEVGQFQGLVASNNYNEHSYLVLNPDVATAVKDGIFPDGLQHWLKYGQFEGRVAV